MDQDTNRPTSALIEGFSDTFLHQRFDDPVPTPPFHRYLWDLCCHDHNHVVMAAPRDHAKSTAITHTFTLASSLFGWSSYTLLVSDTEGQANQFLGDITHELQNNELLINAFQILDFEKDNEADIIVRTQSRRFRITARGAEQKVRGLKWDNRRPDLIVVDDLENDEMVMSKERREKLRQWFYKALLPAGTARTKVRYVGTVLHLDSLLERLLSDPSWLSVRLAAHDETFTRILWPERFSKERLTQIRSRYINQGMPDGYSQEYLNRPIDDASAFYQLAWFQPSSIPEQVRIRRHYYGLVRIYAAGDLAISQKDSADFTAFAVVGVDDQGRRHVLHSRRGRWDSYEIVENILDIQRRFQPELFVLEKGAIQHSIGPYLHTRMLATGVTVNLTTKVPTKDKLTRARSWQGAMRMGTVFFDQEAPWYPDLVQEMTTFPRGKHDDQVDALSLIGLILDELAEELTPDEQEFEDRELFRRALGNHANGRNPVTGY